MRRGRLAAGVARARTLKEIFRLLLANPLIGPFPAYPLAVDVNSSELVDFDENRLTAAGPGRYAGSANALSARVRWLSPTPSTGWSIGRSGSSRLRLPFRTFHGRPLHAIDC
jgi:hypothetical protein